MSSKKVIMMTGPKKGNAIPKPKRTRRKKKGKVLPSRRRARRGQNPPLRRVTTGNPQNVGFAAAASRKRIVVREMEFITDITVQNSPNYNVNQSIAVNPGQAASFPWLSTIAKNYEKYRFLELEYIYKPEVTQFNNNANTGKVMLSTDYDASDAAPTSKRESENADVHVDGMPYEVLRMKPAVGELHKNSDAKFIRPGGLPGGTDIKTYDCANIYVATSAQTANVMIGELHVRYVVELSVPILETASTAPTNNVASFFVSSGPEDIATSATDTNILFGTAANNGLMITNNDGIFFPAPGNYSVDWVVNFTGSTTNMDYVEVSFYKNNILVGVETFFGVETLAAAFSAATLSGSVFVTVNQGDFFNVTAIANFPTGTVESTGSIRWLAV
jgi:hypothetical protein